MTSTLGNMTMIERIIYWSIGNRMVVLLAAIILAFSGFWAMRETPVDAIPDLSDVQVIIKTSYPGQAPQVVEDQVTYPLTTAMLAVPGSTDVRGFSFYGDSYVYVLFEEGTDLYWARSRVLESLSQVAASLPSQAKPALGPDATGVGWIYMYALIDRTGTRDLAQMRSLQDWYLKHELQSLQGVAEVASVGGMVREYQIIVDPMKLAAHSLSAPQVALALQRGNAEQGASVIELAEAEYMIRTTGYIESLDDIRAIPITQPNNGRAVTIADVAHVQTGPAMRRGVADLNGEGEVAGGIVIMRSGENAQNTIARVKERLAELSVGLPEGVEIVTTYDRSQLISRAIDNLQSKLLQELLVVAAVSFLFLRHLGSSLVAIITLPAGILGAFLIMSAQGLNANIMSLGGIAIAIGAMSDGAIVMIDNLHKHLSRATTGKTHWDVVGEATAEVGPALFFSLLIITVSFVPVLALTAEEGRLFAPLAYTKTWAMAVSAGFAITLVPVLLGYAVKGRTSSPRESVAHQWLLNRYHALLNFTLHYPWAALGLVLLITLSCYWPAKQLGSEFMPPLDEGDLMYMPTTLPGISIAEARALLQRTDRLIASMPEVDRVFGKVGRAETATDPAPLTMIETFITLKPRAQWREGMTTEKIKQELNVLVDLPGVSNAWVMPIKARIDMLSTGVKTPIGIKVSGPDLDTLQELAVGIEQALKNHPGTSSIYAERSSGGRYVVIDAKREAAARYGLNIDDVHAQIRHAIGGIKVSEAVEGVARYPISVRYPQPWRDTPEALERLPFITPSGALIALGDVADIRIEDGPAAIKSENAKPSSWILIDLEDVDADQYLDSAKKVLGHAIKIPAGYSIEWTGAYRAAERAKERLSTVIPMTLAIILLLLYLAFKRWTEVMITVATLPLALTGAIWLLWSLDYALSVAVVVGLIALVGLAIEDGIVMLVSLKNAREAMTVADNTSLKRLVIEAAGDRLRPVMMTTATVILGLLPIMFGDEAGSQMMQRIAAPMIGGMGSALVLTLLVVPTAYYLCYRKRR